MSASSQRRVIDDLAPGGLEAVEAGLLELIGDENLHRGFAPLLGA